MENPLKALHRRLFKQGQETVAQEYAAELFQEQAALQSQAAATASQAIDLANQIGAEGDPHKERIQELLKAGIVHSLQTMQQVTAGSMSDEDGREAIQNSPFSEKSKRSEPSLPAGELPQTGQKALPPQQEASMEASQPKKRGRPPKHRIPPGSPGQ